MSMQDNGKQLYSPPKTISLVFERTRIRLVLYLYGIIIPTWSRMKDNSLRSSRHTDIIQKFKRCNKATTFLGLPSRR